MVCCWRSFIIAFIDTLLVVLSMYLALVMRFDGLIPIEYFDNFLRLIPLTAIVMMGSFLAFGLYRRAWEYASIGELLAVIEGVIAGSIINVVVVYVISSYNFPLPRSVFIINGILLIMLIGGSRMAWRIYRDQKLCNMTNGKSKNVLIFGAGDAGVLVAKELKSHYNGAVRIVGFVDDDVKKRKLIVNGINVLGKREDIPKLVKKYKVQEVIIAMPSAEGWMKREIVAICQDNGVKVKTLPGVYDLIDGKVKVSQIREVQVEDLLGRESVAVDLDNITQYIRNQVVLITGGGGSIGSELCRQIARYQPEILLIMDACENNVYEIDLEMRHCFPDLKIVPLVKDIRDRKTVMKIFKMYRPQIVFHAAAHKHVPMMEYNAEEAIKNNVMGTYHVAQVSDLFRVKKFVFISTDKAVNPTSVMGASKRLAEMVIKYLDSISETSYVAVRFGNVLGSAGSVIPLFKKQIAKGGPVTVTHQDMVRYFMTIPEAVQLVIQAGAMAKGGEIFILDMGQPVKIMDLARSLIELSGFTQGKDIEIKITGTRPGEKLYEELLTAEEGISATTHKRIFVAKRGEIFSDLIENSIIARIKNGSLPQNEEDTLLMIQEILPEFRKTENSRTIVADRDQVLDREKAVNCEKARELWTLREEEQEQKMVVDL